MAYYKTVGNGPSLVFLHGWGFDSRIWHVVIQQLLPYYQLTFIDLPGHGYSSEDRSSESLECLANKLRKNIPQHSVLVGWSLGGLIAMQIAAQYPEKIAKLISVAGTPKFISDDNWPGVVVEQADSFMQSVKNNESQALKTFCAWIAPGISQRDLSRYLWRMNGIHSMPMAIKLLSLLFNSDLRGDLEKLNCEQLYLYGDADILTPASQASLVCNRAQQRYHIFSQSGHVPFITEQKLFIKTLREYIDE